MYSKAGQKRKLSFEESVGKGKLASTASGKAGKGSRSAPNNKARVEVEYEIEEEGERVPAQMRILAAQAAQANPSNRGGSADGRSRSSRVLRR